MQRGLLVSRRKGPGGVGALLLAKGEPQLARGREAVGAGRSEGAAGLVAVERAEEVLPEEAVVAADLARWAPSLPFRHRVPSSTVVIRTEAVASNQVGQGGSRPAWGHCRKSRVLRRDARRGCKQRVFAPAPGKPAAFSVAFVSRAPAAVRHLRRRPAPAGRRRAHGGTARTARLRGRLPVRPDLLRPAGRQLGLPGRRPAGGRALPRRLRADRGADRGALRIVR